MNTIKELFNEQQTLVNYFFNNLDYSPIERLSEKILACSGSIHLTGMGKSGIISKNITQMLVSIGVSASYVNPVDALHGDIGLIKTNDVVLFFSKSGQSDEIIQLIPLVRARGAYTVAIVSNSNSIVAIKCDMVITLPLYKELCPFDLAPTTSTILQLVFGNTVVAHLMNVKGLTRDEYAINHPAGRTGKRLTLKVEDVMRKTIHLPICNEESQLIDNICKMTAGFLLITTDNHTLRGFFTDGDLRRALQKHSNDALNMQMRTLMTPKPFTIHPGSFAYDAMIEMERIDPDTGKKSIKELPVIVDEKLVGIVTLHDLLAAGL